MERLTHKARYEAGYKPNKGVKDWQVADRLGAYENTGLTPEQIMELKERMNDGWIPVDERLPEVFGKYWATIRYDDGRISEPVVVNFQGVKQKYVVDTPNGREYETWGIDSAFHGSRVIAWRKYYIPEPYHPERSDNHDGE